MTEAHLGIDRFRGQRVGVFGAGLEGAAALSRLAGTAELVLLVDDLTQPAAVELAARYGCRLIHPADAATLGLDAVIRSAGIPTRRPELVALADGGVVVEGLLAGWLAAHRSATTIGITGTKGKSTTSALCTALLAAAGVDVVFGGNIGVPILDLPDDAAAHVIEVSSYQASDVRHSPQIGVLTSLAADHLTWHEGLENYWHDKLNLFAHDGLRHFLTHPDLLASHPAVATGPWVERAVPDDVTIDDEHHLLLVDGWRPIVLHEPMRLPHNARNLALAVRAARVATTTLTADLVESVAADHRGLPSRLETIAVVDGVRFVDDALASNPLASGTGVQSLAGGPVVLLAGGEDREVPIDEFAALVRDSTHVLAVALFSRTRAAWANALRAAGVDPTRIVEVDTEDVAVAAAAVRHLLRPGTTLLFSPAAPTPAAIGNYTHRSAAFRAVADSFG